MSAPVGERRGDGDWISFREAVRMFATKEELEKTDRLLNDSVTRMNEMPTRAELSERWRREDERYEGLTDATASVEKKIASLGTGLEGKITNLGTDITNYRIEAQRNRIPFWFIGLVALVMPIILVVITHIWKQ